MGNLDGNFTPVLYIGRKVPKGQNPPCPAILLPVQKKFEMYGISCHNNTKFLHAVAEVCLYLMHKKWNSYMYLEPDTTNGNFEFKIMTFILTTCPLQFPEPSEFVLPTLTQNLYLPI